MGIVWVWYVSMRTNSRDFDFWNGRQTSSVLKNVNSKFPIAILARVSFTNFWVGRAESSAWSPRMSASGGSRAAPLRRHDGRGADRGFDQFHWILSFFLKLLTSLVFTLSRAYLLCLIIRNFSLFHFLFVKRSDWLGILSYERANLPLRTIVHAFRQSFDSVIVFSTIVRFEK